MARVKKDSEAPVAEVKSEGPVAVDINNPDHGNLTYEEIQEGK